MTQTHMIMKINELEAETARLRKCVTLLSFMTLIFPRFGLLPYRAFPLLFLA